MNRRIVLALFFGIVCIYTSLYLGALAAVHANGLDVTDNFIAGAGGDTYQYVTLAHVMLEHGRFAMSASAPPESFRTPLYPLLLAGIFAVTHHIEMIPVVQIVIAAASAGLIFLIGTRFGGRTVGLIAALLFAIEPAIPTQAFISATDTLFVFLLLLALYVLVVPKKQELWHVGVGGLLVGALTLVRPLGLYIAPFIVLWLLWEARSYWRDALLHAGLFALGVALLVVPWVIRNYVDFGYPAVSSVGVYNVLFYNIVEFEHQRTGADKTEIIKNIYTQIGAGPTDDVSSLAFTRAERDVEVSYLKAHLLPYALFHLYTTIPFYLGSSIDTLERAVILRGIVDAPLPTDINVTFLIRQGHLRQALSALVGNLPVLLERFLWLMLCVSSFGATVAAVWGNRKAASVALLFFAIVVTFGVLTGPVSYSRYRLPAEPFIFILGCSGIVLLLQKIKTRG